LVTGGENGWDVIVRHAGVVTLMERYVSDDAALERSTEVWSVLLD
jgi:hypothetical protein